MIDLRAIAAALPDDPEAYVRLLGLVPHRGPRRDTTRVLCPWHSEKKPSCDVTVLPGRIGARCRSCNAGGDHLHLAAAAWGIDPRGAGFREVALRLADLLGVTAADTPNAERPKPQDPLVVLASSLERAATDFLDGRPIHPRDAATIDAATDRQVELSTRLIAAGLRRRRIHEVAQEVLDDLVLDRLADAFEAQEPARIARELEAMNLQPATEKAA